MSTMKTTLIFLILFLCSSETKQTSADRLDTTFSHIIQDLQKIKKKDQDLLNFTSINFSVSKTMTCNTSSSEVLEQLNVNLQKIIADKPSKETNKIVRVKKNLEELMHAFHQGQVMTGELHCPRRRCKKGPLKCCIEILQCLYTSCSFSSKQR